MNNTSQSAAGGESESGLFPPVSNTSFLPPYPPIITRTPYQSPIADALGIQIGTLYVRPGRKDIDQLPATEIARGFDFRVFLIVVSVLFAVLIFISLLVMAPALLWVLLVVAAIGITLLLIYIWNADPKSPPPLYMPKIFVDGQAPRISCAVKPTWFDDLTPDELDWMEPVTFRCAKLSTPTNRLSRYISWLFIPVGILVIFLLNLMLPFMASLLGLPAIPLKWHSNLQLTFTVGPAVLLLFHGHMFPSYLRITPGRLELLQYAPFRDEAVSAETLDTTRMTIHYNETEKFISLRMPGEFHYRIDTSSFPEGDKLAKAIVRSALSNRVTPPLPTDTLL